MSALRYIGRFLRGFLLTLLAIFLLLVGVIAFLGFTATGNQFLANRIADQISTPDMQISLEGASGLLQGRFHLDRLTVSDTKGKFAAVERLDLFWVPSEILKWRFHADRIVAAKVTVDRPPIKTIEAAPSDSAFSLPIEVKVDNIDLPLVALGKTIATRDTVLAINGSAQAVSDRIALDLKVAEKDRLNATAAARLAYSVNARTLTLDGSISEPQGGLLARLLSLPGTPPVEVAVKGDGPIDNWKGSVSGRIDGKDVLLLSGSYQVPEAGIHRIALNGGGAISEFMPLELRSLFSGETKVDIDARFSEAGLVDIRTSSITNDSFTLFANGQLDPKGEATLTGDLRPAKDVIHVEWPLASGIVKADVGKADVTFSGAFRSATIDISAALANLSTPDMQAANLALTAHSANLNRADRTGTLSYQLDAGILTLANPDAAKVVQGPVKLKGDIDIAGDIITLGQSELESARLGGKIAGTFTRSTETAAADFNLFLLPSGLLPPDIESKINGTLGLSGKVTATLPSQISVQNLKLTSNLLTAVGSANLDGTLIKADLAGDIANLSDLAPDAAGRAHFALKASGPIARPDIAAHVTSEEIRFAGKALQNIDAKLASALDLAKPGGKLTLAATYLGQSIKAEADAVLDKGLVSIPALEADIGSNTIAGALTLDSAFLPSGKFTFDFPEVAKLAKLAGQTAEGALKGTIDLATIDGKITAKVNAAGPRLNSASVEITSPAIDVRIDDLVAQQLAGKVTAERIAQGANHIDKITLDITHAGPQTWFDLASVFDRAPLIARGEIDQQDEGLTVKLSSLSASPRNIPLTLGQPADIRVANGIVTLENLLVKAGDGLLAINGTAGKTLDLEARITDLPVSLANIFAKDLDAAGRLTANARITGEAASPTVSFDSTIADLATRQTKAAKLPDLNISAKGRFAANTLSVEMTSDLRDQPLKANARVMLDNGAVSVPSFQADIGQTRLSGTLALDRQSQPSGRITFDVPDAGALASVIGQKAEGAIKGTVDLTSDAGKLVAKVDATGTIRNQTIKALAEATSENGAIALPSLKLDIGPNTLSGAITLNQQFMPSGQISFDLPDVALLAAMAGQKAEGAIKGTADIASSGARMTAKVDATGTIRNQSIKALAEATSENGAITLPSFKIDVGPNTLSGAITLNQQFMPSGQISFDLPDVALLAAMAGQKAEGAIKGTADVTSVGAKIDANIVATGTIRGQAINLKTEVASENGVISVPALKADIGANTLTGKVELDPSFMPSGQFSFDFPDVALLAAFAGQQAEGALKGSATLQTVDGKIAGTITADGETLTAAGARIVKPHVDLTMDDLAAGRISGRVTAAQIASGANRLDQLALNVELVDQQTRFDLDSRFDGAPLTAQGNVVQQSDGLKVTLSSFSASPRKIPVKLAKPTDIMIKDGSVALSELAINAGDGTIIVSGAAGKTLDLTAQVSTLPLSLANLFSPGLDAAGALSADIRVTGDASAPIVTFDTKVQQIATRQTRGANLPDLDLSAKGRFADNLLSIEAASNIRDQAVKANAEIKLDNGSLAIPSFRTEIGKSIVSGSLTFDPQFQPSGKIAFDIPDANALAMIVGKTAEGAIKGKADVTSVGSRLNARLDATGTIRGQAIDVKTQVVSENGVISVPALKADIGANTLTGKVDLDPSFMPSGQFSFDFPDVGLLAAFAGQQAEGALKGNATLQTVDGKIAGTITADGETLTAAGARIVKPHVDLTMDDLAAGRISGRVTAAQIASGANRLDQLALNVELVDQQTRFDLDSRFDGAPLTAEGNVVQQGDGLKVTLSSFSAAPRKIPVKLAKPMDILIKDGSVALSELAINAGDGTITVNGAAGKTLDLTAQVSALPLSLVNLLSPGLDAAGALSADIKLTGDASAPVVAFDTKIRQVATRQTRSANLPDLDLAAKGRFADNLLSIDAATSIRDQAVKAVAEIKLDNGSLSIPSFKTEIGNSTVSGALTFDPQFQPSGQIAFDIPDANALAAIVGKTAEGAIKGTADITSAQGKLNARLDATGTVRDQPIKALADISLNNGAVSLPSLKLDVGKNTLSGAVALDKSFMPSGEITFDLPDMALLAAMAGQKAEGAIKGSADITSVGSKLNVKLDATGVVRNQPIKALADISVDNGAISLPSIKLDVGKNTLSGAVALDKRFMPSGKIAFDLPDVALIAAMAGQKAEGAIKGTANITSEAGKVAAKVAATGMIRGQAIDVAVEGVQQDGTISLPSLKLDVGRNTLAGAITLDQRFMPSGKLTFDFPDVALLAAFAGQKAEGAIKGSADIRSEGEKISGAISATGTKLIAAGAEIVKPVVDLKIADLGTGQISGSVTADRISSGANVLSKLALDFDRAGNSTAFDLKSQYDSAPLLAKGAIEQQADGIRISLASFSARPKNIPVKLNKPTEIRIRNGSVALANLAISAGNGSIVVNGGAGNTLDLTAKITALPASLANSFAPGLDAAGTISANVTVKGNSTAPVVSFDTSWQNAAVSQSRAAGLSSFSVNAKGQLAKNVLSINASAKGGDGLSLNANGTVGITGNNALGIKINGQLPFAALAGRLATQGIDLKGNARFDITLSGSATNPSITGRITTSGATLTVIRQNLTINSLAATVNLDGKQARIASLTGKLSGGGTVSVSGTIGITPASGFPADIKIVLKNAVYTDGKVVAAKLSGDLGITGSLIRSPVLNGRIRLSRADITIPQKLPGTLAQVNVKHKNAPREVIIQSQEIKENRPGRRSGKGAGGMKLDLRISAPRQIFVRGRGLDAELGGDVTVTGTSNAPNVAGGFKMLRGRLSIIGRRLDFTEGTITFGGEMMPALNLVASSAVEATTVNVVVSGLANNPAITFTSSPSLPQDEVMALLIFGRSSADLSPVQIAQLADAVATLAGGQSNSLFNKLRQGLGVDDLDVGTDENGKSNVSVGKYLNKRTYLQFQQGVDNSTSKAIINLDIGKGVKLRGEAGTDNSTAGGIFFEKEY